MSFNVGDFMELRKEGKFQREKLCFWTKHYIYTNVKVFELTVSNQSRRSAFRYFFNLRQDGLRKRLCRTNYSLFYHVNDRMTRQEKTLLISFVSYRLFAQSQ